MRNGRLLAEKTPDTLLQEHKTNLLEDIVLKLCRNDLSPSIEDSAKNSNKNGTKGNDLVREALSEISFYSRVNKMLPMISRNHKQKEMNEPSKPGVIGLKFQKTVPIGDHEPPKRRRSSLKRSQSFIDTLSDSLWFRVNRIRALAVRNYLNFFRNPM